MKCKKKYVRGGNLPKLAQGGSSTPIPYDAAGEFIGDSTQTLIQGGSSKPNPNASMAGSALKGAGMGAAVGSVVPVIGTAIGAGVGAIVGGATGLIKGQAAKKEYEDQMLAQKANQVAILNNQYRLQNQEQVNTPTMAKGGGVPNNTPIIDKPVDPYHDLLGAAREDLLKGGIDNPEIYDDENAPSRYFTTLKGNNPNSINPYTQRFIVNYNNRYPDHALDPNKTSLAPIKMDKPWTKIPSSAVDTMSTTTTPIDYMNPGKYNIQSKPKGRALGNNAFGQLASGGFVTPIEGQPHIVNGQQTGGVPVDASGQPIALTGGQPVAEVEGKETSIKIPDKYRPNFSTGDNSDSDTVVMSEQLKKPGTKQSFSDATKRIQSKYTRLRSDDNISKDAMYGEMGKLFQQQEALKQSFNNHIEDVTYAAEGGKININPDNKGKFTESAKNAGMSTQEFARHVMANKDKYSTTEIKRANFAKNAAGWQHDDGGTIPTYAGGGDLPLDRTREFQSQYGLTPDGIVGNKTQAAWSKYGNDFLANSPNKITAIGAENVDDGSGPSNLGSGYNKDVESQMHDSLTNHNSITGTTYSASTKPGDDLYRGSNAGLYTGLGVAAANFGLAAMTPKPTNIQAPMITPQTIDLSSTREAILRNANYRRAVANYGAQRSGASLGQATAMREASDSALNRETGDQLQQLGTSEATTNAGYRNNALQFNAQSGMQAQEQNATNKTAYNKQKLGFIQSGLQAGSQAVQSHYARRGQYDTLNALSENYNMTQDADGTIHMTPKKK